MGYECRDIHELQALHKWLMEFHHTSEINSQELRGSPLLAKVRREVVEALIQCETQKGDADARQKWDCWKQLTPRRPEWEMLCRHIELIRQVWNGPASDWETIIVDLASPYVLDQDSIRSLIPADAFR